MPRFGSPETLQQTLPGPGPRTGLIAAVVLTGGGLHPAQQPRRGPAALGGREGQDAAGSRPPAEADGGRFPVAEAGGEMLGKWLPSFPTQAEGCSPSVLQTFYSGT